MRDQKEYQRETERERDIYCALPETFKVFIAKREKEKKLTSFT